MKSRLLYLLVCICWGSLLIISPVLAANPVYIPVDQTSSYRVELLQNGSNEYPLESGEIPFWQEVVGTNWTQRSSNPEPYDGDYYFFAGAGATAELRQDVDVSQYTALIDNGNQSFNFSGWVRSWDQSPPDVSRVIIEYLNHDKSSILASTDLGAYNSTTSWIQVLHSTLAPSGTRHIRIRLISTRYSGTNNDGYFDGLSLTTSLPVPAAPQNVIVTIDGINVVLSWSPVTSTIDGYPINVSYYNVYASNNPDFVCDYSTLVGASPMSQISFSGWATSEQYKFFKVIAIAAD